jgi:type IV pilus assembly protein PilC
VFSDSKYAHVFDPVFVAFVLLGTKSGDLGPPLRDLGEMYRWQLHIAALMKKALILPAIILIGVALVSYYITARVVPTFMGILDGLDADLPPLTLAVKAVSELVSRPDFTLLLAGTITFGVLSFNRYRKTPQGKAAVDRLVLRLPVAGNLMRTFILARFSRSFAVMLRNGVPTVEALLICASVAENEVYRKYIHDMRRNHTQGLPMYPVLLAAEKHFPDAYTQQFKAAEEKSILKSNLQYLGDMLNSEVTNQAEGLASSIEPLIMVLLGGVVGILVLAVFGPMTNMIGALQK